MKRAHGSTRWCAPQTALKLPRPTCCCAVPANFLARDSLVNWGSTSPIRFAIRNCSNLLARKPLLWSKTHLSGTNCNACSASCRGNGSAGITWRRWDRMRVIAGAYRSRILKSLKGLALRPTSARLRETLFNVLGPAVAESRVLDLFAGTGAVGIEALSRGANAVVFVENHGPAAALIRRNLEALGIRKSATVLVMDALS